MNILLDTHILLWTLADDSNLSQKAREILCSEHTIIYYSVVSLWEISIKHSIHPDIMAYDPSVIQHYCDLAGFYGLPLTNEHVLNLDSLKYSAGHKPHKDPFDRILLSQAKTEKLSFLTHDALFKGYDEDCVMLV